MLYVILGSICAALCVGLIAVFVVYLRRRLRDYASACLSDYADDDLVPDDVSRKVFFKGLGFTLCIAFIAAVIICALLVAAWLLIYKGVSVI